MIEVENSDVNGKIYPEKSKVKGQKAKNPNLTMKKMRQVRHQNKQDKIYQLDLILDKNDLLETTIDCKGKFFMYLCLGTSHKSYCKTN